MKKIRVLIVDDSAVVRQALQQVLESDPMIEVMGTAGDPFVAVQRIAKEVPDVITLDVEMPRMDGLTFLDRLMAQCPVPVVICSTLTEQGSATALAALEKGAVDVLTKPKLGTKQFFEESCIRICDVVKSAARARLHQCRHVGKGELRDVGLQRLDRLRGALRRDDLHVQSGILVVALGEGHIPGRVAAEHNKVQRQRDFGQRLVLRQRDTARARSHQRESQDANQHCSQHGISPQSLTAITPFTLLTTK